METTRNGIDRRGKEEEREEEIGEMNPIRRLRLKSILPEVINAALPRRKVSIMKRPSL